ncbi:hypothetical protein FRC09_011441, partial [Ceratobasidium sp. 395]
FNIACSRAQSSSQLLAFRFLAGLGMETRSDKLGFRPSPVTEDPIGPVAACLAQKGKPPTVETRRVGLPLPGF